MNINATFLGFLAILLWSTSIGLIRTITESLGASVGAATIYTLSGLMIIAFRGFPRVFHFSKLYLYGCGLLFVLYEILFSQAIGYAQDRLQTMEVTLLNYFWPCLTVVFAILFNLQKNNKLIWFGTIIAFMGIIYSLTEGDIFTFISIGTRLMRDPIPYVFALSGAILWALFCCMTKKYGQGQNGTSLFLLITGVSLWVKYFTFDHYDFHFDLSVSLEVFFIGIATALGYSFWHYGIQKGNMILLSIISYFTPLLSIFFAGLWLSLSLSLAFWIGVILVTMGSLVCYLGSRKAQQIEIKDK